jgi:hypothetical protein
MGENRGSRALTRGVAAAEDAEARAASEAAGVHPGGATLLEDRGPGATLAVARATLATAAVATETRKGKTLACTSNMYTAI